MSYIEPEWEHNEEKKKEFIKNLAPIVLFTYNRLDHTRKTVEALQNNLYAHESDLYIYSDAPKNITTKQQVENVRMYLRSIIGFKRVTVIERQENWGLAKNIIDGVTKIVNQYGKIIVLEDDIVTSQYFLKYMNDALEIYKEENKVMQIGGYMYPIETAGLQETFFLRIGDCWGWATWDDAWKYFERDPQKIINTFSKSDIVDLTFDNSVDWWGQVIANQKGEIYTWAIFWCTSILKNHGLVLYPSYSMTRNIGFDNTGEHCIATDSFEVLIHQNPIKYFPEKIEEDRKAYLAWREYFRKNKPTIFRRIKNKLCFAFKRILNRSITKSDKEKGNV